jgi:hypothetical protein
MKKLQWRKRFACGSSYAVDRHHPHSRVFKARGRIVQRTDEFITE